MPCTEWPIAITTAGCGDTGPLGETCDSHVKRVDFDGFAIDWHVETTTDHRWRAMWRNGPTTRPIRSR